MEINKAVLDNELNDMDLETVAGGGGEAGCKVEVDDKGNKKVVCEVKWTW